VGDPARALGRGYIKVTPRPVPSSRDSAARFRDCSESWPIGVERVPGCIPRGPRDRRRRPLPGARCHSRARTNSTTDLRTRPWRRRRLLTCPHEVVSGGALNKQRKASATTWTDVRTRRHQPAPSEVGATGPTILPVEIKLTSALVTGFGDRERMRRSFPAHLWTNASGHTQRPPPTCHDIGKRWTLAFSFGPPARHGGNRGINDLGQGRWWRYLFFARGLPQANEHDCDRVPILIIGFRHMSVEGPAAGCKRL
jgi:hypothetical protein